MVSLGSQQSLFVISFGFFKPILLRIIMPTIITMSLSQASHITHVPQGNDLKPNSCENHDNKGWTLATYKEREEEACTNEKDNYNKNLGIPMYELFPIHLMI
jgi:hypothetical protein